MSCMQGPYTRFNWIFIFPKKLLFAFVLNAFQQTFVLNGRVKAIRRVEATEVLYYSVRRLEVGSK